MTVTIMQHNVTVILNPHYGTLIVSWWVPAAVTASLPATFSEFFFFFMLVSKKYKCQPTLKLRERSDSTAKVCLQQYKTGSTMLGHDRISLTLNKLLKTSETLLPLIK